MAAAASHNKQSISNAYTNKKRKIADVDATEVSDVGGKARQRDISAPRDDSEDEYAAEYRNFDEFEGLLAEELEQTSHAVLSPSQPLRSGIASLPKPSCLAPTDAMMLSQSAFPPLSQTASQIPKSYSQEDEDAIISQQEKALALRYGLRHDHSNTSDNFDPPFDDTISVKHSTSSFKVSASSFYGSKASVGFTSGRGKSIAAPSAQAMQKAQRIFETSEEPPSRHIHDFPDVGLSVEQSPAVTTSMQISRPQIAALRLGLLKQVANKRIKTEAAVLPRYTLEEYSTMTEPNATNECDLETNATPSNPMQGLTVGGGTQIAPPWVNLAAASHRLAPHRAGIVAGSPPLISSTVLFTSGSGEAVNMPSPEKVSKVEDKLDASIRETVICENSQEISNATPAQKAQDSDPLRLGQELDEHTFRPASQVAKQLFTTGRGNSVAMPSKAAIARAAAFMQDEEISQDHAHTFSPIRPVLATRTNLPFSPLRSDALSSPAKQAGAGNTNRSPFVPKIISKPFKPPTAVHSKLNQPSTPGRHFINGITSTSLSQSSQNRRLDESLSMIPRNTPSARASGLAGRGSFRTPFKNGSRPSENVLRSLRKDTRAIKPDLAAVMEASRAIDPSLKPNSARQKSTSRDPAFILHCDRPRVPLIDAGFHPGLHIDDLIDAGLPNELLFMNLQKAADYKFEGNEGREAAYDDLVYYSDCTHVSQAWVNNHYALIVWKLAGMIRAKPSIRQEFWNFEVVCNQLKYRYEREVNQANRSCIKRIQERDSPPSLPMTLIVSNVFYEERPCVQEMRTKPDPAAEPQIEQIAIGIELSDGWYRIKANLDEAMYRAHFFDQLPIGAKIHIQSAKLDSGSEGGEPLEAYESSSLIISGNSTCRAHWASKLGFRRQRGPAVCAFRSLTPDGGLVPYVDVRITKVYPLGYKGEYKQGESQDVWNEVEERERQREWENLRQLAELDVMKEQQKSVAKMLEIQQQLQDAISAATDRCSGTGARPIAGSKLDDFVDIFEAIEAEPSKASQVLRGLSRDTLQETLQYAQSRMESMQTDAAHDMHKELDQRCPPRTARCFCIVRARDVHDRDIEGGRECQLNVNDPTRFGEGFLAEGKRYLISNLLPARITGWSAPKAKVGEIFLNTRFDSRWHCLQ